MNLGSVAALIAAVAFVALVVGLLIAISKVPKLITELQATVQRVNTAIDVLTKDVDGISLEVESLLNKANYLVDDINGKVEKVDPLFTAVGDLGVTVSEINVSAKDTATNLISGIGKPKPSKVAKLAKNANTLSKLSKWGKVEKPDPQVEEIKPEVQVKEAAEPSVSYSDLERELKALAEQNRSRTAGEININRGGSQDE